MKLKIILSCLVFIVFQCISTAESSKKKPSDLFLAGLNKRQGLPNFLVKAIKGDSLKVAYLGGSITAQEGWRVYSLKWFKERFPNSQFSEINAAIGGTGSDFGVFRLYDHVMQFKPDLVFIEFAVNDDGWQNDLIIRSMEGIVRQIWKAAPKTDICFIYTMRESFLVAEHAGNLPNSAKTMELVADRYGIPSINFGAEVTKQIFNKQLIFTDQAKEKNGVKVFSPDGVHPYEEVGHVIYNDVLKSAFETMISSEKTHPKKHSLPKPIAADFYSSTRMLDINPEMLSKSWQMETIIDKSEFAPFGKYLKSVWKAKQTGETLSIRFKGQAIGAYDIMGPDAGRIIVEIDGAIKDTISRFDAYCTYRRMNSFLIDHLENKEHVAVFRTLCEPFDKKAILSTRNEVMINPDDFRENNWYVGKILLDGELK